MKLLEEYRDPEFVKRCDNLIANFINETPGVSDVLLSTPDGFEIASYTTNTEHNADKLAAVGSSMFAMGASLVRELGLNEAKSIIINSNSGKIYIQGIRENEKNSSSSLVLLLQTTNKAMLATIIYGANKLSDSIQLLL